MSRLIPGSAGFYDGLADAVAQLYKWALTDLPPDVRTAVATAVEQEEGAARTRLNVMVKAVHTSDETGMIVCQDTGICVFFVRIGTRFPLDGCALTTALSDGIERATAKYALRSAWAAPPMPA